VAANGEFEVCEGRMEEEYRRTFPLTRQRDGRRRQPRAGVRAVLERVSALGSRRVRGE